VLGGGIYLGSYRGVVLEITDWLFCLGSATMGYRLYGPLGDVLKASVLKSWTDDWIYGVSWVFFALPTFVLILSLGLHLDRLAKEQDRVPPEVRKYAGGFVAIFKYLILLGIWVGFMNGSTLMTEGELAAFRKASMVTQIRNMDGPAIIMVRIAAPPAQAKKFIDNMNKP
jgi:hypothetical protein